MVNDNNNVESVERQQQNAKHRVGSRTRSFLLLVVLALGILLLWPAKWGGVFGIILVDGHSMEPTFRTGDAVISMKAPDYRVGDIIAYQVSDHQIGEGGHVIHRIIKITHDRGQTTYITQGDNNPSPDAWKVVKGDVFGKKLIAIPKIGAYLMTSQGGLILGSVLALVVIVAIWPTSSRHAKHSESATTSTTTGA